MTHAQIAPDQTQLSSRVGVCVIVLEVEKKSGG